MLEFWLLKVINLFLASLFFAGAWSAKRVIGVWLNPASIFLLFWFLYSTLPLLLAFEAPVNPWAIVYILTFGLFFSLPFSLFRWNKAFENNSEKLPAAHYFNKPIISAAFFVCSALAIILISITILDQGISLQQIIQAPLSVGGEYAGKRYSGELVGSISAQLGLQLSYYTATLGGLLYGSRRPSEYRVLFLFTAFLPAMLVMLLQSAKGLFFFSIFLFIGGILVTRIYNKNYTLISYASARTLMLYGVVALPLVISSFLSRGIHQLDDSYLLIERLRLYLISYSSVHLPAYSDWFSQRYFDSSLFNYKQESGTLGFYTFMAFFRLFGDDRVVPMGTYDEYFAYGDFISGNLFTVFRGILTDFSLFGSLLFAFIVGYICAAVYKQLLTKIFSTFSIVFFIFFVGMSYQTYLISSLTWLTIPLVFIIQWAILHLIVKIRL